MTYNDFVTKAIEATIEVDETSGFFYLQPDYKLILISEGLGHVEEISDFPISEDDLLNILKLTVEKRNARTDKTRIVIEWISDILTEAISPAEQAANNDLMKNMMDYMQLNDSLKEKEKELSDKENELERKKQAANVIPVGINIAKR